MPYSRSTSSKTMLFGSCSSTLLGIPLKLGVEGPFQRRALYCLAMGGCGRSEVSARAGSKDGKVLCEAGATVTVGASRARAHGRARELQPRHVTESSRQR